MTDKTVWFLDEQFTFPEELNEYSNYLWWLETLLKLLQNLLIEQMQSGEFSGGAEEDFAYYAEPLKSVVEHVISDLAEKGVYDVTIQELLYDNSGYINLHQICEETMSAMQEINNFRLDALRDGMNQAAVYANSKVTGSGISIYTNSMAHALAYTALETREVQKQTRVAEASYRVMVSSLENRVDRDHAELVKQLLTDVYYPVVYGCLDLFMSNLKEVCLQKLNDVGRFTFDRLKQFDKKRSANILENLDISKESAKEIVRQAFLYCPYNEDVYYYAWMYCNPSISTFETAVYFGLSELLANNMELACKQDYNAACDFSITVKALQVMQSKSEVDVLQSICCSKILAISNKYESISRAVLSGENLKYWIKYNLSEDFVSFCDMSDVKINQEISDIIETEALEDYWIQKLLDANALDCSIFGISFDSKNKLTDFHAYKKSIKSTLIALVLSSHGEMIKYRYGCLDEASKVKSKVDSLVVELDGLRRKVSDLQEERNAVRFFDFSKRKELREKIERLENQIGITTRDNVLGKLQSEYKMLMQKANCFPE